MYKKNLIMIMSILANYRKNFAIAIDDQQNILEEITNLPVYFVNSKNKSILIIEAINAINKKLITRVAQLNKINSVLLKVNSIEELIYCIKKFEVFNLDKDVILCLEKQEKFLDSCKSKGFITNITLKSFEQTCILLNSLYLTAINQIEICEGYISNYLKTSNINAEIDDQNDLENEQ